MIIYCTYYGSDDSWGRMHHVLRNSIKANCSDAQYIYERSAPNPGMIKTMEKACRNDYQRMNIKAYVANTHKVNLWADMADEAYEKGENLVLIDADTMVLSDLSEAFDEMGDADVGVTYREAAVRINAGVVYVRPTEQGREWIRAWKDANDWLIEQRRLDQAKLYGGINQASMAIALDGFRLVMNGDSPTDATVAQLECSKWNSVDQTWHLFNDDTRVVHIKGALRKYLVEGEAFRTKATHLSTAWLDPIKKEWDKYDRGKSSGGINRARIKRNNR